MAGREKNCKWYFADQPNVQEVGPNNAMEQNFKAYPYASLVRESIQNSLDAVYDKKQPVRVTFSIKEMNGTDYPEFFKLKDHIQGCLDYFPNNHNAKALYEPMLRLFADNLFHEHLGYIRVSDFNTKGMPYEEGKTDSPFYAFVRSAGVSAKDDVSAGGSFGFGKAAYYLLSPISTIIVSTCTQEYDKYFEGVTSLCTHTYKGSKKVAFGYYDDQDGKPVTEETDIPVKFRRSEPGTDINILGFEMKRSDEAVREMTEAVVRNFWMAIFNGKLIVDVNDTISIDKDNISELMEQLFEDDCDNTRKAGYYNPRPYFDAVRLADTTNKYMLFEDTLPLLGHVCFFVTKFKGATDKIVYMRATQMLIYTKRSNTNYGMYGVFYCDSEKGNDILRNMENPAHNEWKSSNWRVSGRVCGMGRVALQEMDDFITECLSQAFSLRDKKAIDIKGLEDFLYIPTTYEEDEELDSESYTGNSTGIVKEDGTSVTTDLADEENNPVITENSTPPSTGHVMINRLANATNVSGGSLRSGHGTVKTKHNTPGIQKPGDAKNSRTEDENGESGLFASPVSIPYRTFSQTENGSVYHYVVLHPQEDIGNVRLHFIAVGEENDEELNVAESDIGTVRGNTICDICLREGYVRMKVRFTDNMKHSVKLSAEELYEV